MNDAIAQLKSGELPPRTRRIRHTTHQGDHYGGTTSAHAENTGISKDKRPVQRNYLRARGEYWNFQRQTPRTEELPPRTRRILLSRLRTLPTRGTTSAHAENTRHQPGNDKHDRNYLRARGEYAYPRRVNKAKAELPPRTRRIPLIKMFLMGSRGTTSAHAENT